MLTKYLALLSLMGNERRPAEQLHRLQQTKLRRLIHQAYRYIPFYRNLFERRGLVPDDIQGVEDLQKLPVIDKSDFRTRPVTNFLNPQFGSMADLIRVSTSGSSGIPFDVYIDKRYNNFRKAQYLRPYLSNGRRLTDKVLHFTGFASNKQKWLTQLGLLREWRVDCSTAHEAQIKAIMTYRPDIIQGFASSLVPLASIILSKELEIPRPRLVFTDSELLSPESRKLIEAAFRAPVIDVFGSFETDNIAYECRHRQGYHIAIDCAVLEILKDNLPVEDGAEGEMVCTVLDNLAMPLIRYNLHDIAAQAIVPCGYDRTFPLLKVIGGRVADRVYLPGGVTQSPASFLIPFDGLSSIVTEFQIIQESLEHFRVIIVPTAHFDDAARAKVQSIFTSRYPSFKVTVDLVDRIEREASGKRRAFISRIRPGP